MFVVQWPGFWTFQTFPRLF